MSSEPPPEDPLAAQFVYLSQRYGQLETENRRLRKVVGHIIESAIAALLIDCKDGEEIAEPQGGQGGNQDL